MTRRSRCQTREIPLDLRVVRRWQLSDVTEVVHGQRPDACGCPPGRRMRLRLRRRVMSLSSLSSDGDAKRRRTKSGRASRLCGGTIDVVSLENAVLGQIANGQFARAFFEKSVDLCSGSFPSIPLSKRLFKNLCLLSLRRLRGSFHLFRPIGRSAAL